MIYVRYVILVYVTISCFSAYDYVIPARGKELVKTDLQIELPHGCYGRIAPRSGLAWKNFIDVGGELGYISFRYSISEDLELCELNSMIFSWSY